MLKFVISIAVVAIMLGIIGHIRSSNLLQYISVILLAISIILLGLYGIIWWYNSYELTPEQRAEGAVRTGQFLCALVTVFVFVPLTIFTGIFLFSGISFHNYTAQTSDAMITLKMLKNYCFINPKIWRFKTSDGQIYNTKLDKNFYLPFFEYLWFKLQSKLKNDDIRRAKEKEIFDELNKIALADIDKMKEKIQKDTEKSLKRIRKQREEYLASLTASEFLTDFTKGE